MTITPFLPITVARRPARAAVSPNAARALVLGAAAAGAAAGILATDPALAAQAAAQAGEGLARLLRAMAAMKAAMAIALLGAVAWRLASPISALRLAGYAASAAVMAAGPGLIWMLARVGLGAALLHAGLFAAAVMLWRDPAVGDRLTALIQKRARVRDYDASSRRA